MVNVGEATTTGPEFELKPPDGAHAYVDAPPAFNVIPGAPEHIVAEGGITVTTGVGLTVTITTVVEVHAPFVPVTVYEVVMAGLAFTIEPVMALNPVAGLHVYDDAPLAVSVTLSPEHTEAGEGVTTTVGVLFTVMVTVWVELQLPLVPVTV